MERSAPTSNVDTIVAIATPLGEGGLGVVRLSGPQTFTIGDALFRSKKKLSEAANHTLHHGWIENIDEVIASVFRAPHSYTGEDVVEFSCHGSPVVLKDVVRLCEAHGARPARPGEFTERAYLNGKLDLPQAEAVATLIHAQSSRARAAATQQLQGQLSMRVNVLREQLIKLLAQIEANLDFAEEGVPIIETDKAVKALENVLAGLEDLLATSMKGRLLREGVRVAFAGKPNVGKSSLFNALLAEDRAIVTDVPGTTRDTLEEKMEWNGVPITLVDTAGLRATADSVESQGTARAKRAHEQADVVLLVLDVSAPLTNEDREIANQLKDKKVVTAFNKVDKISSSAMASATHLITDANPASAKLAAMVSAQSGEGLAELKKTIVNAVATNATAETESSVIVTNLRHVHHLEKTRGHLVSARDAVRTNQSEESIAIDLRAALEQLGAITGESVTEDVLSSIFRQFCIGK